MDTISIIVLNWRTPSLTVDTVNSLLKIDHNGFKFRIYIIDNGSGDDSLPQFHRNFDNNKLVYIHDTGSNLGYVDGNNVGIQLAISKDNPDYLLVINSDVVVKKNFLEVLHKFLVAHKDHGMVGPKIYFAPGYEFHKERYSKSEKGKVIWSVGGKIDWNNVYGSNLGIDDVDNGQYDQNNSEVDYLSGCCLLIRRQIVDKIGPFDSRYFMYSEDADYSRKIINHGYKIAYLYQSVIWHVNSGSSGRGPIHDYFLTRNRLLFGFRYCSLRTRFALFRDSIKILFTSPFPWQRIGVRDFYLQRLGKGSWK